MRTKLLSLLFLLICVRALAQGAGESLLIGPGDLLSVHVFREAELDTKVRVKDAGTATLPLVGPVQVVGMAPTEAAAAIADRYKEGRYLNQPQVSVFVEQAAVERIAVLGEVARPGAVAATSGRDLLDVLADAGGLLKTADRHVTIRHGSAPARTLLVPNDGTAQAALSHALVMPGDIVLVPRAGIVYVLGDVGRPGGYLMQDDSRLTLLEALALAAGSTKTSAENHVRLLRKAGDATVEIPLRLKEIEQGKQADIALENDDVLYVPFSFGKNLTLGASSIAASASSAIIYTAF